MAVGLRIRRPDDGRIWFDTTTSQFRYLGQVDVSGSGSMSVPDFALGTPVYFVVPFNDDRGNSIDVSASGTTLSWSFPISATTKRIIYGYRP